ncbi:AMP-binding protein [Mycolicibacterium moriokaense]|nr:AMP-binding protein [Mycolicibacterium moriokaense]
MRMHFADIWESIALARPDAPAVIQGDRLLSWRDYERRAARFAGLLEQRGVGTEAKVAILLHNCPEYLETQFGALKARAVPVNVNYRYCPGELVQLLENADAEVLVYHSSLAERVRPAIARLPDLRLLLEVNDTEVDDSTAQHAPSVPGALTYESALAGAAPQPVIARFEDDLYMLYTGGTTGLPKGVMYDIGDMTRTFLNGGATLYAQSSATDPIVTAPHALVTAERHYANATLACPPLMHGAGMWIAAMTPHLFGAPVVLLPNRSFDGKAFLHTVAEQRVAVAVIVGDAFGRPIVDALDAYPPGLDPLELSSLQVIVSSGAMLSDGVKDRLIEHLPELTVLDMLGSSEGSMGRSVARRGLSPGAARFVPNPGVRVVRQDGSEVTPGSGEVGTVAIADTMVPRGYYKDPERSARAFPVIDGVRHSLPGDMATVDADGSVRLLGRGNACINTGGEKVYPEEVEQAIKAHPSVADSLVFGVEDELLGQRVVAIVEFTPGAEPPPDEAVIGGVRDRLSRYKAPREIRRVARVPRTPSGKADYNLARQLFLQSEVPSL